MSYRHERIIKRQNDINTIYDPYYKTLEFISNEKQVKNVDIYTISGNKILTTTNLNLNINVLNKGIYIIVITLNNNEYKITKICI